ncbi:MAG: hypothetical protein ACYSSO_12945 [Planctomycetota bacterium]|jgi:hypothetical protein
MKKIALIVSLFSCIFYLGCSGRTPNPVLEYMPGDDALCCEELKVEMAKVRREIELKPAKIKEREARNQGLNVFGALLIYPWFEMDILKAEETEIQALNTRYNRLLMIAYKKGCRTENRVLTIQVPGGKKPTAEDILREDQRFVPTAALFDIP